MIITNGNYKNEYTLTIKVYKAEQNARQALFEVTSITKKTTTPTVALKFYKEDFSGNSLSGAKIEVSGASNVKEIKGTLKESTKKGYMGKLTLTPNKNNGTIKIKLTETKAPEECVKLGSSVVLTINYNTKNGNITGITPDKESQHFTFKKGSTGIIHIKNQSKIISNLMLYKLDKSGKNYIKGAEFEIYFNNVKSVTIGKKTYLLSDIRKNKNKDKNGEYYEYKSGNLTFKSPINNDGDKDRLYIQGLKTDEYGQIGIRELVSTSASKVYMTVTETKAPSGYEMLPTKVHLILTYNDKNGTWNLNKRNKTTDPNTNNNNLYFNEEKLKGYVSIDSKELELTMKDDSKIDKLTILKTDLDNSKLSGVEFRVTLTNVKTAKLGTKNYKENNGKLVISNAKTDNGNITLTNIVIKDATKPVGVTIEETKVPSADYKKIEGKINLTITKDGNSYKVEATKDKTVLDDEFKASNVKVNGSEIVLNIKNKSVINLSGQVWVDEQQGEKVVVPPNGKKDENERRLDGVKVHLYSVKDEKVIKTTTTSNGGKYEFTDVTKTAEGYKIQFEYNGILYNDVGMTEDSKAKEEDSERSTLNDKFKVIDVNGANGSKYGEHNATYFKNYVDGSQPAGAAIKAYTDVYRDKTSNIDCGLLEKDFDVAVGTDLNSAKVTINGKEANYTYAQVLNGELQKDLQAFQGISANTYGNYDLYLSKSDYNYRIKDYETSKIPSKVNPDGSVNPEEYDIKQELEVYVTYSVVLKNQSHHKATITKFEYTYDDAFVPYNITETDKYKVNIDENNRKITFTSKEDGLSINAPNYRNQIDLTFKVKKNNDGNLILKEACTNIVEILEYKTNEGGLIDIDSVPGNGIDNDEDDYDKAPALNIAIGKKKVRTIEGTVFEDENKNGSNDDSIPVNDVIVQLIEIKTKTIGNVTNYYEYIWQETRSGSNIVKRNGYTETEYTSDASGAGTYQFKDFIPGNYIIRFIYGDGSTYDITTDEYKNSAVNVKKYNGQDYKSTIDNSYKEEWYNQANYNGKSVARDNEARRLEVMAYSTTINERTGNEINKKEKEMLDKTWMCAETSKVSVEIKIDENTHPYANMNFGLTLRPKTTLTLEKHITGLKITPQGTGSQPIVDAKVVNGQIQGITTGLARMPSTRENRGFWKVETDIEELAQGATVELEYTYTIKNESDVDYLSTQLIDAYENPTGKTYNETLSEIRNTIKQQMRTGNYSYSNNNTIGTYLGQYYYNNNSTGLAPVSSKVNLIEDNLNNNLKLVEETDMAFEKANNEAEEKPVYDDAGNKKPEKIETVIRNKKATEALAKNGVDSTRTVKLTTTLSSSNKEISYPAYIGEIVEYTNAAGRKDMEATPGNLSYVHSEDTRKTMKSSNEHDEFWGETLMVSKPTGENKQAPMQIVIIAISSIAVIGVGIILIKKFVLKK